MAMVKYSQKAWKKIKTWVDICPKEISGFGTVKIVDDQYYITDAFLLKQEVTGTETDIDPNAIAEFMCEMRGTEKELGEIRLWWHSHVNMDVFWSSTDEAAIKTIGGNPYFISTVFNKKGKTKTRVDSFMPLQITMDDLKIEVESDNEYLDFCKKEYKEKVSVKKPVSIKNSKNKNKSTNWGYGSRSKQGNLIIKDYTKNHKISNKRKKETDSIINKIENFSASWSLSYNNADDEIERKEIMESGSHFIQKMYEELLRMDDEDDRLIILNNADDIELEHLSDSRWNILNYVAEAMDVDLSEFDYEENESWFKEYNDVNKAILRELK